MVIIFPLREKLSTLFMQQRPKYTGGRQVVLPPVLPWNIMNRPPAINFGKVALPPIVSASLPINFGLCEIIALPVPKNKVIQLPPDKFPNPTKPTKPTKPSVVHALKPLPATDFTISGITKDNTGAVESFCTVNLFRVENTSPKTYTFISTTVSDANGVYSFFVNPVNMYMVVALNAATGETTAGATLNNLTGS